MSKLECVHADTCLPDYWGGHHLPHVQIPVMPGMSLREVRDALHSELNEGAVMGSDPIVRDDSGPEGDKWYRRAHAAVNRIRPATKGYRGGHFNDVEVGDDDSETVYAFFVFVEE